MKTPYPKSDDPLREPILYRRNGTIRRQRMQRYRSVPMMRRAWFVTLTTTEADRETDFGSHDLVAGLTWLPQEFWCFSRRKARALVSRDLLAGGSATMYQVEYRLCPVCGRVLLGPAAREYREKQLKPKRLWHYPEGPACNLDCKPKGRGPGGEHLTYRKDKNGQSRQDGNTQRAA